MDELITIVIIAAAIIFKVVGRKLGSSGGDEVFPNIPVDSDMKKYLDEEDDVVDDETERSLPVQPVHKPVAPLSSVAPAKQVEVKAQTPILEEEQTMQREKIDPKKLIVYSEIMKPKYNE